MATFKIDGQDIPFEAGDTIIRAAWRQGIEIPHYCWHPGLSVAANCRMCLVEVTSGRPMMMPILKWDAAKNDYVAAVKPKLQPACQTGAAEGLEVATQSPEVKNAQSSVQELLLLNHPVDCPICDQAGECKLQDYWADHQQKLKRKRTEPVHKPKAVRFGPTIVYDAERCIMCTRCIRVCNEVAKDPVLDMRERGNRNEIVLAPGRQLDHAYSLMTEHVCPVGALTSRDFRFKARVWFLKTQPSVCSGCATGCSAHADFDPRNQTIYRLRPRDNAAVNQYWMCDAGMMTYKRQDLARVQTAHVAHVGGGSEGAPGAGPERRMVLIESALDVAAESLGRVARGQLAMVLSAQHASEDNHALARLGRTLGAKLYLAAVEPATIGWEGDAILRHADPNPNRAGATLSAGVSLGTVADLLADVASGAVKGVLALGAESSASLYTPALLEALAPLANPGTPSALVALTSHASDFASLASVVIPVASHFEMAGTFVNAKGLAQTFKRVVAPAPGVEPAWRTIVELASRLGIPMEWAGLKELRADLGAASPVYAAIGTEVRV